MLKAGMLCLLNRVTLNLHRTSITLIAVGLLGWASVNVSPLQAHQDPQGSPAPVISIPLDEPNYGEPVAGRGDRP